MDPRQRVMSIVEETEVTLEEHTDRTPMELIAEAPPGHHWAATGTHVLVSHWTAGQKREAWAELHLGMRSGTRPCYSDDGLCLCSSDGTCEWWDE